MNGTRKTPVNPADSRGKSGVARWDVGGAGPGWWPVSFLVRAPGWPVILERKTKPRMGSEAQGMAGAHRLPAG